MSRAGAAGLAVIAAVASGCSDRPIRLELHTPSSCCREVDPERPCVEDPCPLRDLLSIQTTLERADGTTAVGACAEAPADVCSYDDLEGFAFIDDVEVEGGLEVRLEGFPAEGCSGDLLFRCESFGDNVVDLRREGLVVPMWCDCAPIGR